jgi:hypothetical protein
MFNTIIADILAGIQLVAALLPIIEAAFAQFGNTQAAADTITSAIPAGLSAGLQKHVSTFAAAHLLRLAAVAGAA